MKPACLILLLLPLWGAAQPYVLVDRSLESPVRVNEQLSVEDFAGTVFPLHARDLDVLVHTLDSLARRFTANSDLPDNIEAVVSAQCAVLLWHPSDTPRNIYSGLLKVTVGDFTAPLYLANASSRRTVARRLKQLSDYLRNNRSLARL